MKILHILNTNKFSGAENVAITIINNMKNDNEIVYVSPDGSIRKYLEENQINYEPIEKVCVKEIRRVIKKYNPDIIHAHDFTASIISAMGTPKKIKIISHIHNNNIWIKKINLKTIIYLLSTLRYKKILIVSKSIIDEYVFKKFISKKIKVVGNIINIGKVKKMAQEKKFQEEYDIIFMGRLAEPKQPRKFIEVVKRLKDKFETIKAVIVGDGPLKEQSEQFIKENNLENNIELKGFKKNPYIYLKNSKILCMTSKYEGYGLVAVEALVLGKPVVATDVGGIPNIVNESCGKITSNINEMVDEITKLLNDENYYNEKSKNALKRSQEINDIDKYILKLKEIYSQ